MTDSGLAALSADESAYFASGGEGTIPAEGAEGSGAPGGEGGTGSDVATKPAATNKGGGDPVPLATFLEEKNARKALDTANRDLQTQLAELRGKFSVIDRLNAKPGEGEDAKKGPPTPEEDIFGNVKHVGETVAQLQKRLDDADAATKKAGEDAAANQTFVNNYRQDAAAFEVTTPDFKPAYNFLLEARAAELIAVGYDDPKALQAAGATPDEVHAAAKALHDALTADEYAIAQMAQSKKKSAAEMLYNLAKQRGYKSESTAVAPSKGAEKLDTIERGQQANKSLSTAGGSSGDAEMTAERLLSMPMDEFETWVDKNPTKAKRIMGG